MVEAEAMAEQKTVANCRLTMVLMAGREAAAQSVAEPPVAEREDGDGVFYGLLGVGSALVIPQAPLGVAPRLDTGAEPRSMLWPAVLWWPASEEGSDSRK